MTGDRLAWPKRHIAGTPMQVGTLPSLGRCDQFAIRIVWFVAMWLLGVAITGVVAFVIRAVLGVSG